MEKKIEREREIRGGGGGGERDLEEECRKRLLVL